MDKRKGWIIYNGSILTNKFINLAKSLNEAFDRRGISTTIIRNNELIITLDQGNLEIKGKYKGIKPDFVLFWDKDIRLASHLESMGMKLYNPSHAIAVSDDKTLTYQTLVGKGINMPKTIIAPMIYEGSLASDLNLYNYIQQEIKFPMIVKEAFGSFGEQVYMVNNTEELLEKVRTIGAKPHLYQEFVHSSFGRDIRLNVVGDRVVACMLRKSSKDFRSNISAGGKMESFSPTKEQSELAVKSVKLIGADFAGVDLLFGKDEEPILCEINSNAHMENIYNCTGIDVTDYIIDYVIKDLEVGHER